MAKTHTINHAALGAVQGRLVEHDGIEVIHFRSIPYATIPTRFSRSIVLDSLPDDFDGRPKGDFTSYGYGCPQIEQGRDGRGGWIAGEEERKYDEFKCLNLTISAPKSISNKDSSSPLLPVMVYVHGGGFFNGAGHISALHDTTRMVAMSISEGTPVIIINIGYRLHTLGFLTSSDLLETSPDESPFNNGLFDQRNAFLWIQKNITSFGGDPSNITAFGESAGSASLAYHLCCNVPLFRRAILQSGGVGTMPPPTFSELDKSYTRLLTYLSINESTAGARIAALRAIPVEDLTKTSLKVSEGITSPFAADTAPHGFFAGRAENPTYLTAPSLIRACPWIESLVIGDCHFEGEVVGNHIRHTDPTLFLQTLHAHFHAPPVQRILETYNVTPKTDSHAFWRSIMELIGDIMFNEVADRMADTLSPVKKIYRYTLALSNPFPSPSPLIGRVGPHCVEILYLFMTLLEKYPAWREGFYARQAREMARRWIRFGNGLEPWEEYGGGFGEEEKGERKIAVCDDLKGWEIRTLKEDEEVSREDPWGPRRYEGRRVLKAAFDAVAADGEEDGVAAEKVEAARRAVLDFAGYRRQNAWSG